MRTKWVLIMVFFALLGVGFLSTYAASEPPLDRWGLHIFLKGMAKRSKAPEPPMGSEALMELRAVDDSAQPSRTTEGIRKRIEDMAGQHFKEWSRVAGIDYPPDFVLLKIYKEEAELEIWAGSNSTKLKRVIAFPVCAMDFRPGPKLKEGDGRTPEGRYALQSYGSSKNWFMWMDLSPNNIDNFGSVGTGSAFRLCTDYPRDVDIARSKSIGIKNPGSAICIHGNCVSAGCPSLRNRDFTAVFAFVSHHNVTKYGHPMVEIYPFRASQGLDLTKEASKAAQVNADSQKLGAAQIKAYWEGLYK